mmetsp:Transcript_292/g.530  ORF Transcript_292/g.530 Transcript_292/m.530 type:complete len:217 (+) Transcript_292:759-1409(+)
MRIAQIRPIITEWIRFHVISIFTFLLRNNFWRLAHQLERKIQRNLDASVQFAGRWRQLTVCCGRIQWFHLVWFPLQPIPTGVVEKLHPVHFACFENALVRIHFGIDADDSRPPWKSTQVRPHQRVFNGLCEMRVFHTSQWSQCSTRRISVVLLHTRCWLIVRVLQSSAICCGFRDCVGLFCGFRSLRFGWWRENKAACLFWSALSRSSRSILGVGS